MRTRYDVYDLDDALERFDFATCQRFLADAYWTPGISRVEVERGFRNSSLVVGAFAAQLQVGCLRVVSNRTRFAFLMDVYVNAAHRGRGLGRALVRSALEHPDLALVTKWALVTLDAEGVYAPLGFGPLAHPERWMTRETQRPWLSP